MANYTDTLPSIPKAMEENEELRKENERLKEELSKRPTDLSSPLLVKIIAELITDKLADRAREYEDLSEQRKRELKQEEPERVKDWDHKDWRWMDPQMHHYYNAEHLLWELCGEVDSFLSRLGIE